jgi:hypothetical protein
MILSLFDNIKIYIFAIHFLNIIKINQTIIN